MATFKEKKITIAITVPKIFIWFSGLWLFILAILSACSVPHLTTVLFATSSNHYNGDKAAIVLISAFLFLVLTTFVTRHRYFKLITGIAFLIFALIGIIGALITSTSEAGTWVIFVGYLIAVIGTIFWILEGLDLIKTKKTGPVKEVSKLT